MIHFDLNIDGLQRIADELGASEKQYRASFARACQRTAATLRKMSGQGLKTELQLRTLGAMRNRLKTIRMKGTKDGVQLWYGLNDMPVSSFKGRPRQDVGGAWAGKFYHEGGFIGKAQKKNKLTIFKRQGKQRLPIVEQLQSIKDQADIFIEDQIFVKLEDIFWQHFVRDIRARVKYLETSERW